MTEIKGERYGKLCLSRKYRLLSHGNRQGELVGENALIEGLDETLFVKLTVRW